MPRYYFDVEDNTGVHRDDVGLDLETMELAIVEARKALADMAHEVLGSGAAAPLQILIRDGDEGPVKLALQVTTEHLDE